MLSLMRGLGGGGVGEREEQYSSSSSSSFSLSSPLVMRPLASMGLDPDTTLGPALARFVNSRNLTIGGLGCGGSSILQSGGAIDGWVGGGLVGR